MAKAILIMDMPSSCSECNIQAFGACSAVRKFVAVTPTHLKSKPKWCPLREVPRKIAFRDSDITRLEKIGYNACIDEILGGGE